MTSGLTLGEKIRAVRKRLKMTQQELAGDEFTKSFISQLEKNEANPSLKSLQIIAKRLNKPVSFFLDESVEESDLATESDSPRISKLLEMARRARAAGDTDEAVAYVEEALSICSEESYHQHGLCLELLGSILLDQGKYGEAVPHLQNAVEDLQLAGEIERALQTQNALGVAQYRHGDIATARETWEAAIALLHQEAVCNQQLELRLMVNAGIALADLGELDRAAGFLAQGMDLSAQTDNFYRYGDICMSLAHIFAQEHRTLEAVALTERALDFFRAINRLESALQACTDLAVYNRSLGHYDKAYAYLKEGAILAEQLGGRSKALANHYYEWGETLLANEDDRKLPQAAECFRKALALHHSPSVDAKARRGLAEVCLRQGETDQALQELKIAVSLLEEEMSGAEADRYDHRALLADIYSRLGELCTEQGNLQEANRYLTRSVKLLKK